MHDLLQRLDNAARQAGRPPPRLLAVSKFQDATAVAELVGAWRAARPGETPALGENYVQETQAKQAALGDPGLEWHLVGHLQSNKAREAAALFDWVQSVDRPKLVAALAAHRDPERAPLNVLLQVNIDDEASKHGCGPEDVPALADAIAAQPRLALRGLMAIPAPLPDLERRREAFRRMRALFEQLRPGYPQVDTLSMGMSDDATLAIAEGATMVRVGTALFGSRERKGGRPGTPSTS
ncbi:YggS family pyridoxal phosphate-dependent enzyme [Luteimonas sp. 50]|uniref:Pyridoxal phosphate homeostasis protein n=1 Tax=Cognatiluteimonas sedimenti TaxID=2927791 RepID=A0ABT0A499_9GAMM|nr:YggS family pyridoxal phosphate-dependent enzyme [Lysobacter sedimenti]MCJ0825806.1 YggS family pyridoxal phosphate-dependent enzyme [Lysobacter sedimenti]